MRTATVKQGRMSSSLLAAAMCLGVIVGQASGRVITVRLGFNGDPNDPNPALRTQSGEGNDDAEENVDTGSIDRGSSDLELGFVGSTPQLVGMRFVNVDLAQGETILEARIQFADDGEGDEQAGSARETNLLISGELSPDPPTFAGSDFNISLRPRTTVPKVAWNDHPPWGVLARVSEDQLSTNFASVVQEIVNQPAWAAGNAMVIIIEGTGERTAGSWNGEQNAAPILIVTTTGGPHAKVIHRRTAHALDEAEASLAGNIKGSSSDIELGDGQIVGLRYLDLNIPQGSTITYAHIQFQRDENQSAQTDLIISGELSPNAARFVQGANILDRPFTAQFGDSITGDFVEWFDVPPWSDATTAGGEQAQLEQRTPNFAVVVQAIVNQPGWEAGNAMVIFVDQFTSTSHRTAESFSSDTDAAPLLEIHYTPPPGFSPDPIVAAQVDDPLTVDLAISGVCNATEEVTYGFSSADASVAGVAGTSTFVADGPPFTQADVEFTYTGSDVGTTTLTASRVGGATTACPDVTVEVQVIAAQSVDLQPLDQMQIADQQQMVVIGDFLAAGTREFAAAANTTYQVEIIDDPDGLGVVEIGPGGVITAISLGTVRITATNNNKSDSELLDVVAGASKTISVRISNGLDDAEEHIIGKDGIVGFMEDPPNHTSSDLELGEEGSGDIQIVGLRFLNIDIPPGATIEAAHIQFKVDNDNTGDTNLRIFGAPEPDAGPICSEPFCLSTRGETAASVAWLNVPPWTEIGLIGPDQRTPNFAVVVQEIIDLPGWAAGNAMLIMIDGSGERTAESFNGDAPGAPLLEITFTLEAGFSPAPILIAEIDPSP